MIKVFMFAIVVLGGCSTAAPPSRQPTVVAECPPIPVTFRESDLVGTWVAKYRGTGATDTLALSEDGTYIQSYVEPLSGYRFESGRQRWSVEPRKGGLLRLHLKGMRRCDDIRSLCEREGGGLGGPYPIKYDAIDYCEGERIEMPDEIILVVTGVAERNAPFAPRGIWLRNMRLPGSDWTYSFELQP